MNRISQISGILGVITATSLIFWGVTTKLWIEPRNFEIERLSKINEECNQQIILFKNFKEEREQLIKQINDLKTDNNNLKNNYIDKEKYNELKNMVKNKTDLENQLIILEETKLIDSKLIDDLQNKILMFENQNIIASRIDSLTSKKDFILSYIVEGYQYLEELRLEKLEYNEDYEEEFNLKISISEEKVVFFQKQVDELDEQIKVLMSKL